MGNTMLMAGKRGWLAVTIPERASIRGYELLRTYTSHRFIAIHSLK